MSGPPPFHLGQQAARAGKARADNPFGQKPDAPATGDAYPGPWHNWDAGWLNATATAAHDQSLVDKTR